jgi:hypothetical protein
MKAILKDQTALLASLSMLLAMMSLGAALFQNYIYIRQLEVMQRDVGRAEHIRTCKDVIETYFQVKLKVGLIARTAEREGMGSASGAGSMLEIEAANSISRFAALGTYLANFHSEDTRYQYTQLSWTLEKVLAVAPNTPSGDVGKLFEPADKLFAAMNDDCVRSAKAVPL